MLQFGASLTDGTSIINYDRIVFMIQATDVDFKKGSILKKYFFSLFETTKVARRNGFNGKAKYGHTQIRYKE